MAGSAPARVVLKDCSGLMERPEWLGPRDLMEVFGIGRTKAFEV